MKKIILFILLICFPVFVSAVEVKEELEEPETVIHDVKGAFLSKLEVQDFNISPTFDKMNNVYTLTVPEEIEKITINATPENETSRVQVIGDNNLNYGENIIVVTVSFENDTQEYQLFVTREKSAPTFKEVIQDEDEKTITSLNKDNYLIMIVAGSAGIIIIGLAIAMFRKKK